MAATQKVRRFGPDALLLGGKLEVAVSQETLESSPQLGLTPAPDAAQPLPSSFLPLEVFDNPETMEPLLLETWHHLSETPVSARSRFRSTSGDTSWEPCTVIRHDPASGTFTIRWGSGRTKQVTRLNLQFDSEDERRFRARLGAARALRSQVEAEARYHQCALGGGVERTVAAPAQIVAWFEGITSQALGAQLEIYSQAMGRAALDQSLRTCSVSTPPGLPPPSDAPAPSLGVEAIWPAAGTGATPLPSPPALVADSALLRCTRRVWAESLWLSATSLVAGLPMELPCRLDEFIETQATHVDGVGRRLREEWVPACERILAQEVGAMRGVSTNSYAHGRGPRLLQLLRLMMQDQLQALEYSTLAEILRLVCRFAVPASECSSPVIQWVHEWPPAAPPLLAVALRLEDSSLVFAPTLEEVAAALEGLFDRAAGATAGLPAVVASELGVDALEELRSLDKAASDDARLCPRRMSVLAARGEVRRMVERSLERPRQLRAHMAQFEELASMAESGYLDGLRESAPSLEAFGVELRRWGEVAETVRAAAPSEVHCRLLLVHTEELRAELVAKAETLQRGVADLLHAELVEKTASVASRSSSLLASLTQDSDSTEAAMAMKEQLDSAADECGDISLTVATELLARAAVLDQFSYALPDETSAALHEAVGWPHRIEQQAAAAQLKQERDTIQFQEQLQSDRERFGEQLEAWEAEAKTLTAFNANSNVEETSAHVTELKEQLEAAKQQGALYNSRAVLFGWEQIEYPQLAELEKALEPHANLWRIAAAFSRAHPTWMEGPVVEISTEQVEQDVDEWRRQLYKVSKLLVGHEGPLGVISQVRAKLDDFKEHLPLLAAVLNPGLRERHWRHLDETLGKSVKPQPGVTTLAMLLEEGVDKDLAALQEVSEMASKEHSLEKTLDKMLAEWRPVVFDTAEYRDTGTHILRALDEIQSLFDDHIVKTQAMRGSPFIRPFEARVHAWEAKLIGMQEVIDEWLKCQSVWLYLEPIFSSEDIMRQMPQEAMRFTQVDRLWRKVMASTVAKPNVLQATATEGLLASWQEANSKLDLIQKGLNDYLEAKRLSFARLFFLSNDELLQILSETKATPDVAPHLRGDTPDARDTPFAGPDARAAAPQKVFRGYCLARLHRRAPHHGHEVRGGRGRPSRRACRPERRKWHGREVAAPGGGRDEAVRLDTDQEVRGGVQDVSPHRLGD